MYRILIADDEGIVIDSLKLMIQRHFGEHCVMAAAKSGRTVIELAEQFHPDIVFMDIQMPGINGIDAIEEIQKSNSRIQFIILSAYDKFAYAKKALQLGVLEYMMKPFNTDKVISCLQQAMKKVDEERQKRSFELKNKEKLEAVIPIIESGFIYHILFEDHQNTPKKWNDLCDLLGIKKDYAYLMIVEYGDALEDGKMTNPIGASVKAQAFYQEFREIVKEFFMGVVGPVMANRIILLNFCEQPEMEYHERIQIINQAHEMVRKLKRRLTAEFRVGIGSVNAAQQLKGSYADAQKALKGATHLVSHIRDIAAWNDSLEDRIALMQALERYLEQGDMLQMRAVGQKLAALIFDNDGDTLDDCKGMLLDLVFQISGRFAAEYDPRQYYKEVLVLSSKNSLRQWLFHVFDELLRDQKRISHPAVGGGIGKSQSYIEQNFHRDLSLEEVSQVANISPYYFSKCFKEETGVNFIEYVTQLRMDKAKQLLYSADKTMKEICLEIGYADPNYFSRTFKKQIGVTPTEYREKGLR